MHYYLFQLTTSQIVALHVVLVCPNPLQREHLFTLLPPKGPSTPLRIRRFCGLPRARHAGGGSNALSSRSAVSSLSSACKGGKGSVDNLISFSSAFGG